MVPTMKGGDVVTTAAMTAAGIAAAIVVLTVAEIAAGALDRGLDRLREDVGVRGLGHLHGGVRGHLRHAGVRGHVAAVRAGARDEGARGNVAQAPKRQVAV